MIAKIPDLYKDLFESTVEVMLTTITPAGYPHNTLVWCSFDGTYVLLNTGIGYHKERNMRKNPKVSVFASDSKDKLRWVEVQGEVELIEDGAVEHLNELSFAYTEKRDFYRDVLPQLEGKETRVIVKVTPRKVMTSGGQGLRQT